MATWECAECTAVYSVGAPKCPQCGSTVRVNEQTQPPEEEQDMAKITVHGGPSIAETPAADAPPEGAEAPEVQPVPDESSEEASADASPAAAPEETAPEEPKPVAAQRKPRSR